MKISLKDPFIVCRFEADAVYLRHYQDLLGKLSNGDEIREAIETHLKRCKARQDFIIIATDEVINIITDEDEEEFISQEDMKI